MSEEQKTEQKTKREKHEISRQQLKIMRLAGLRKLQTSTCYTNASPEYKQVVKAAVRKLKADG